MILSLKIKRNREREKRRKGEWDKWRKGKRENWRKGERKEGRYWVTNPNGIYKF